MPVLRREDGVNFVLQPYRETLAIRNTSLLRKEINYLAELYGKNIRLFKRRGGEYEAVFSNDYGILLGETIWHYFDQNPELIYCEVLHTKDAKEPQVLLVIVREAKVYLDTKIPIESLADEVFSLLTESTARYTVYTQGDLPDVFGHPAVKKHILLEKPLFPGLKTSPAFQLLKIDQALDEQGLSVKHRSSLIVVTMVCLGILGGLWWYVHKQEKEKTVTVYVNPYQEYEQALQTPDPRQQIDALITGIQKVNRLAGWYGGNVIYDGKTAKMPLHSLGGTASQLMTEAQALNLDIDFGSEGASVSFPTEVKKRNAPARIASEKQTIVLIIDRMMQILPGKSVQINNTVQNTVFKQTGITISFSNIAPEILQLIALNLEDLPVSLVSVSASFNGGLFTGTFQLNVVGN
jgi:hypothetical protein